MEKRRLYATEHDALIKLRVAENVLRHLRDQNQLGERVKLVPYGARDLGGAISGVQRLLENLLATVPDNQRKTISRNVASASYTIGVKRPGGTRNIDDWGMWISLRSLNQLLEGLHDHCLVCDKDLSQQKACPLKRRSTSCRAIFLTKEMEGADSMELFKNMNDYQQAAQRTSNTEGAESNCMDKLVNGALGLCGEAGECIDIVKKALFQGHPLDIAKLAEELGDVLWYCAEMASGMGVPLAVIAEENIAKLRKRYPDGFEAERSVNREAEHGEDA